MTGRHFSHQSLFKLNKTTPYDTKTPSHDYIQTNTQVSLQYLEKSSPGMQLLKEVVEKWWGRSAVQLEPGQGSVSNSDCRGHTSGVPTTSLTHTGIISESIFTVANASKASCSVVVMAASVVLWCSTSRLTTATRSLSSSTLSFSAPTTSSGSYIHTHTVQDSFTSTLSTVPAGSWAPPAVARAIRRAWPLSSSCSRCTPAGNPKISGSSSPVTPCNAPPPPLSPPSPSLTINLPFLKLFIVYKKINQNFKLQINLPRTSGNSPAKPPPSTSSPGAGWGGSSKPLRFRDRLSTSLRMLLITRWSSDLSTRPP
ncbi:hypothetical protein E2C01_004346 [Portunus trituberculatus]|uniref:Uncharacterized protein n=1 Tax=Portunus trituberculatus TaxID=210409 RepID=A0A5B7CSS5_PORTR|nr:hypothetical protein [Portunus trituberculatus]